MGEGGLAGVHRVAERLEGSERQRRAQQGMREDSEELGIRV